MNYVFLFLHFYNENLQNATLIMIIIIIIICFWYIESVFSKAISIFKNQM